MSRGGEPSGVDYRPIASCAWTFRPAAVYGACGRNGVWIPRFVDGSSLRWEGATEVFWIGEVRMVPVSPTATSWVPVETTEVRAPGDPEFQYVQVAPSGEVDT